MVLLYLYRSFLGLKINPSLYNSQQVYKYEKKWNNRQYFIFLISYRYKCRYMYVILYPSEKSYLYDIFKYYRGSLDPVVDVIMIWWFWAMRFSMSCVISKYRVVWGLYSRKSHCSKLFASLPKSSLSQNRVTQNRAAQRYSSFVPF